MFSLLGPPLSSNALISLDNMCITGMDIEQLACRGNSKQRPDSREVDRRETVATKSLSNNRMGAKSFVNGASEVGSSPWDH